MIDLIIYRHLGCCTSSISLKVMLKDIDICKNIKKLKLHFSYNKTLIGLILNKDKKRFLLSVFNLKKLNLEKKFSKNDFKTFKAYFII